MLFKGTETKSAADIAQILDRLGGHSNAYTTKERTCFYATCLSSALAETTHLLADMILHPRMSDADLAMERGVIFEEIDMYEDTPEDLVFDLISRNSFASCPVGRPILGTRAALNRLNGEQLRAYMQAHYTGPNLIVALSGNFSDADLTNIEALFSEVPDGIKNKSRRTVYNTSRTIRHKQIEQVHLCLCFPALSEVDPDRYTMRILNAVFGDGMSSRLFQRVREKEGLCYSVGGFHSSVSDAGVYEIYTATSFDQQTAAIRAIMEEVDALCTNGITEDELNRAREQLEANLLISLEGTGARSGLIAKTELQFGEVPDIDRMLAAYHAVSSEDIRQLAGRIFQKERLSFAAVGNVLSLEEYDRVL
jgi:predicted Zn-dependent peptidase